MAPIMTNRTKKTILFVLIVTAVVVGGTYLGR